VSVLPLSSPQLSGVEVGAAAAKVAAPRARMVEARILILLVGFWFEVVLEW
jgi:hypothetical protein